LIGLAAGFGSLWIVRELGTAALKQEAMGFGDVKLMGALGALFGWQAVIYIVFISAFIGSIAGITLIALHRKGIQSQIPYGPYISLAAFSWLLGGFNLWEAYLRLMGL
jgi:leader peptidase (prepilin peptidase)/N-methyltransferase